MTSPSPSPDPPAAPRPPSFLWPAFRAVWSTLWGKVSITFLGALLVLFTNALAAGDRLFGVIDNTILWTIIIIATPAGTIAFVIAVLDRALALAATHTPPSLPPTSPEPPLVHFGPVRSLDGGDLYVMGVKLIPARSMERPARSFPVSATVHLNGVEADLSWASDGAHWAELTENGPITDLLVTRVGYQPRGTEMIFGSPPVTVADPRHTAELEPVITLLTGTQTLGAARLTFSPAPPGTYQDYTVAVHPVTPSAPSLTATASPDPPGGPVARFGAVEHWPDTEGHPERHHYFILVKVQPSQSTPRPARRVPVRADLVTPSASADLTWPGRGAPTETTLQENGEWTRLYIGYAAPLPRDQSGLGVCFGKAGVLVPDPGAPGPLAARITLYSGALVLGSVALTFSRRADGADHPYHIATGPELPAT